MHRLTILVAAVALLAGCSRGPSSPSPHPRPELGEQAAPLQQTSVPPASPARTEPATVPARNVTPAPGAPSTTNVPSAEPALPPAAGPTTVSIADGRGDTDRAAPPYADLVAVTLVSSASRLRVTVELGGDVPRVLPKGEVAGLGVDLFRSGDTESDHQLFADGGNDGWVAYLQTPDGFVAYPGTFERGGTLLVFDVPWSALGGRAALEVAAFLDWSRDGLVLNDVSTDRAPDSGRATLAA